MIQVLYNSSKGTVLNKGKLSATFGLERGCRQGDPLSPYLYLICAEIMSLILRSNNNIKGMKLRNEEILLSLFADDTTLFLDGTENTFKKAIQTLDLFAKISGLKINNDKTQIVWIGNKRNCGTKYMVDRNFVWDPGTFKILGITFSTNLDRIVDLNYNNKIEEAKREVAKWRKRNITPIGKITVIKTLILSRLTYLLTNLPDPTKSFLEELDKIIFEFLWGSKHNRIKKKSICKNYEEGGLKMCNIYSMLAAYKISWLKRVEKISESEFLSLKLYPDIQCLTKFGNAYLTIAKRNIKNAFWQDVLKHFHKLAQTTWGIERNNLEEIMEEPLHYNQNIKRGQKTIYIKEWVEHNILKIRDLTDNNLSILTFNAFKSKYEHINTTNFLHYNGIASAIKEYLLKLNNPLYKTTLSNLSWNIVRKGNQKVREILNSDKNPPTATMKWNRLFPNLNWRKIFIKCFRTTAETKLQWFQTRLIHRILPTNRYLYVCKIKESSMCTFCEMEEETIQHLFWNCNIVRHFWAELEAQLHSKCDNCARLSLSMELVLFGVKDNVITDKAFDYLILFAKFFIYKCKLQSTQPNCTPFIHNLKFQVKLQRIADSRHKSRQKWYPYQSLLDV